MNDQELRELGAAHARQDFENRQGASPNANWGNVVYDESYQATWQQLNESEARDG